jgi:LysR family glycine cleavage system transcriptional activator
VKINLFHTHWVVKLTNMQRLPLNTLPAFQAVAELQNLRAAADVLHLTHSAVSQQIRVLEEQLGFPLFERRGRGVVLNPAGEILLHSVQQALQQLNEGMRTASAVASSGQHRIRLTVQPSLAQRWLLARIRRWHDLHPHLLLDIDVTHEKVDLRRRGFHVALRQGQGSWEGLASESLFDQPVRLWVFGCVADAQRLMGQDTAALLREPLLGDPAVWQAWFAAAGTDAGNITPVAEISDLGLMLQAAEQGMGLVYAPVFLAADALREGRLARMSPVSVDYGEYQSFYLVYPPKLREWPPLVDFRQWVRDEMNVTLQGLELADSSS